MRTIVGVEEICDPDTKLGASENALVRRPSGENVMDEIAICGDVCGGRATKARLGTGLFEVVSAFPTQFEVSGGQPRAEQKCDRIRRDSVL